MPPETGTRSGAPLAPISYVYNADNQLVSAGGVTYTYDAAGRRTQESSIVGGQPRTIQYTWDARDRLVSYRDVSGPTASYVYDWAGLRQGKSGSPGPITQLTDRDSMTGFAQLVGSSSATRADTFVWGGDLISTMEGGAERFRLADSLGSTRILTGSNGAITDTFDYTALGDLLGHVGPSSVPHRYAGEQSDPESGLIYLRARYYDPRSGVFVSRDSREGTPGYPLSLNRYVYADGNPVNRTDPSGHETLVSLSFAQGLQTYARGQDVLRVRRGLVAAFDVEANAARVAGGVMGVEAVIEAIGGDHARINQWFGVGRLASAAADILAAGLGGGLNSAVDVVAGLAMLKTSFDMLGRNDVYIGIEGVGVLLANSVDEAQNQLRADTSTGNLCVKKPGEALAWAIQPSATKKAGIELCRKFFSQPFAPNASTLTTRARASMAGIMLHEYTHLALKTKDAPFDCHAVAKSLVPGAALFNADSYRCWGEDAAIGWSGSSLPKP